MKKVLLTIITLFVLTGCGKYNGDDAMKDFSEMVTKTKNYTLKGNMEILSNEETYKYSVNVIYKEGDYYKVNLLNKENNHEQIILKNMEGVYVITPSLNKSFKFQSEWPNNSSQAYILGTILNDLENDKDKTFKIKDKNYIFTTKVNYPNNRNLIKEEITLDKKMKLKKVQVINAEGITTIKLNVTSFDTKTKHKETMFDLDKNVTNATEKEQTTMKPYEDTIYPMYLPKNTKFQKEESINVKNSNRTILTFTGEKPFTLIEETIKPLDNFNVIPVFGEIAIGGNFIATISKNSLNWTNHGKEFYLIGENLSNEELLKVASSTNASGIMK